MSQEDKRFVIQEHTRALDVHWDFMLEWGKTLQTYRLDKAPQQIHHGPANAVKIFDHPLKFLTYQGPVNKGRGNVRIVDAGKYQIVHQEHSRIELKLAGRILKGEFMLCHVKDDKWRFSAGSESC
jgi:hypothetical protein